MPFRIILYNPDQGTENESFRNFTGVILEIKLGAGHRYEDKEEVINHERGDNDKGKPFTYPVINREIQIKGNANTQAVIGKISKVHQFGKTIIMDIIRKFQRGLQSKNQEFDPAESRIEVPFEQKVIQVVRFIIKKCKKQERKKDPYCPYPG